MQPLAVIRNLLCVTETLLSINTPLCCLLNSLERWKKYVYVYRVSYRVRDNFQDELMSLCSCCCVAIVICLSKSPTISYCHSSDCEVYAGEM